MTSARDATELVDAVDRLRELVDEAQRPAVDELLRRLREQRFRVLVVGEAKRGKSTLINALLGREVLPVGVVPVTAVTTTVAFGARERVLVDYHGGASQEEPLDALADFVTEVQNPGNRLGVERVTVLLDAPLVRDGVELVDTPGAGSVYSHSAEAEKALTTMDAAVFVLTADPPLSASERDLLVTVADAAVRTFLVLNKADRLDDAELRDVAEFVADAAGAALGVVPEVFACSARQALQARLAGVDDRASGVPRFEAEFVRYLRTGRGTGLQQSVARRARGTALQALDGVRVRLRLAGMRTEEAAARAAEFRRRLDRIAQHAADARDLAGAGVRHLLEQLNAAAAQAEPVLAATVAAAIRGHLDAELAGLPAADLRQRGRPVVVDTVRETADGWRTQQQTLLEQGLRDLEERLRVGLAGDLQGLRAAARDLLDLDLAAEDDRSRLVEDPRFFYLLTESLGWSELVTDTLRRHLLGAAARRRATADLLAEADRLIRQQVGRIRADFQYRLQESGRGLGRALANRYAASTAVIETALDEASQAHGQTSAESGRIGSVLANRESALQGLLRDLDTLLAC